MSWNHFVEWLSKPLVAAYFQGAATISAVLLALFAEKFFEFRRRPRLCVEFDNSEKDDLRFLPPPYAGSMKPGEEREEIWIRLRIRNQGRTPARDVELRFISAQHGNRPSWWFKVSNFNGVSITVPPKFTQYFDLAYVKNVKGDTEDVSFYLAIVHGDNLLPWPEEKRRIETDKKDNRLDLGWRNELFFAVVSSNADAKYYRMAITVAPRRNEDPPLEDLLGADRLRARLQLTGPEQVPPRKAFPQNHPGISAWFRRGNIKAH